MSETRELDAVFARMEVHFDLFDALRSFRRFATASTGSSRTCRCTSAASA
jgi:hypothetical protein